MMSKRRAAGGTIDNRISHLTEHQAKHVSVAAALRWAGRSSLWTSRALAWLLIAAALICAAVVLSLRYWFLPNIEHYRQDIAAAVSRAANLRITIGRISADWDGMRPHLKLEQVTVYDELGRRALDLARVESTIAWRSIPTLRPHFHSLDVFRPTLAVRRDAKGRLSVAGITMRPEDTKSSFSEWLLQQPDVEVHDATVSWTDELRAAPVLELSAVRLQMVNGGGRHRFGLHAQPPPALAGPIDARGDMRGTSADILSNLNGQVYLQLDSADLAAWRAWIDLPLELKQGAGAVRSWLTFSNNELSAISADVRLSGVLTRLRANLPQLELNAVAGWLSWKRLPSGYELSTQRLALTGGGTALPPADLLLRVTSDKQGVPQGQLQANVLNLASLVMLADRLPLADEVRAQLLRFSPEGSVYDLTLKWQGALPAPARYSARGRFELLSFKQVDKWPGVSGLSGHADGNELGGTLHVSGQAAHFELPQVFAAPIDFETLTAQMSWNRLSGRTELRFHNLSFANADGAGTAFGSYRTAEGGRGDIDLTGTLTRADARAAPRYIPINELQKVKAWLARAVVAGHSNDVRFKVKGRLEDFPFAREDRGIFQVAAKVSGGTLDYAERWPRIENIEGEFQFRGARLDFVARHGYINGVKLGPVTGEIPDLKARPEILIIRGEAEGSSADFLGFIAKSPVTDMIERFSEGMQASGAGRLALKLTLPLGQLESSKVAGTYVFNNNRVVLEREIPPLEQASGRIEFTESSAHLPALSATFLGGPLSASAQAQRDAATRVTLQGRINADQMRKAGAPAWMQHLRGASDWRGSLTLRKKAPELVIESNLQGLSSSLPAPFAKSAAESVALRIERRAVDALHDRISVGYGDGMRAELVTRRVPGMPAQIERGVVRLGGGEVTEPDKPGVWVRGALKTFDFGEWLALIRSSDGDSAEAGQAIAGVDMKLAQVDFFGHRFSDLGVSGTTQKGVTQLNLAGREIEGAVTWRGEGKGRLVARLKKLTLASMKAAPLATSTKPPTDKFRELPALDVVVDQFEYGQKQLGKLELNAIAQERDWRIERLQLTNADSALTAEGVWQGWLTQPRTRLNVRVEASDVGAALERWKLPTAVRRGTAKIEGHLAWAGSPHDFDYPSLSGELSVEAAKGQFLKMEPGLAKLLGILSLQALPRRITLDFRDVFSDGFAFDGIVGAMKIERGIATTDNLRIAGPAARVIMSGEVDLVHETQKLRVRVIPHLSDSVSLAGALLGGPVVGIAAFLAQKIFKDPFEQLAAFEYGVTGTWSDPQVLRVERATNTTVIEGTP